MLAPRDNKQVQIQKLKYVVCSLFSSEITDKDWNLKTENLLKTANYLGWHYLISKISYARNQNFGLYILFQNLIKKYLF